MTVAVCVDSSETSEIALSEASEFANQIDEDLLIVHGVQEQVDDQNLTIESNGGAIEKAFELLHYVEDEARSNIENDVYSELISDDSSNNRIVREVAEYLNNRDDISYVFVAHRNLDPKREELMGSFAKKLISESNHPVVTVTPGNQ